MCFCLLSFKYSHLTFYPFFVKFCLNNNFYICYSPCFSIFSDILDEVIHRAGDCSSQALTNVETFLMALMEKPLPSPGTSMELTLFDGMGRSTFIFKRPNDNESMLDHVRLFFSSFLLFSSIFFVSFFLFSFF